MHRIVIAITTLLLTVSCDRGEPTTNKADASAPGADRAATTPTSAPEADRAATTPTTPTTPATAQDGAGTAATPVFASLSECLGSCERPDVLPTNRATCRLNCDTAHGASATREPPTAADPFARAGECLGACYSGSSDELEACIGACKSTAASVASPPPVEVIDRLDACVHSCHVDTTVLPTNRSTCALNCTQRARVAATPPPDATPPGTATPPSDAPPRAP